MDQRLARLLPARIRRRYARQFIAISVVVLLVLAIALWGIAGMLGAAERQQVVGQLTTDAEQNSLTVGSWADQFTSATVTASRSAAVVGTDDDPDLETVREDLPDSVTAVHYVNTANNELLQSTAGVQGTDLPWLATGSIRVSEPRDVAITVPYDKRISFVSPVPERPDRALVVETSLEESIPLRTQIDGAEIAVAKRGGSTLFAHDGEQFRSTISRDETDWQFVKNATGSATVAETGGILRTYAATPSSDLVVMTRAPSSVYDIGWDTYQYLAALFGIVAVSLLVLGLAFVRPTARSVNDLVERAEAIEDGDFDVEMDSSRQDELGRLSASLASMRDALAARIDEIEDAREQARAEADEARREAEQAREEAEAFTDHLEATANEYGETMRACADGDLTRRLDPDEESDAMAEIARAFNDTMSELEATVARVRDFADGVADSTTDAASATASVQETSQQVSDSMADIADEAAEQYDKLQEVTDEMNDLSATVEEVAATADTVAELARETEQFASEGASAASEAMTDMETIETATEETVDDIRSLDDAVDQVADIVDMIDDIAEQTNVLALNASIEASHADGSGDGFAVVADEVKELAGQTREATREIDALLTDLSDQTTAAVEDITVMQQDVVAGVETTQGALDALDEIADQVEETSDGVREISDATDQQAATAEEVVTIADQVATVSEQTAHRADDVAEQATAQASDLQSVTETATGIERQAAELSELLDSFTVSSSIETAGGDRSPAATDD